MISKSEMLLKGDKDAQYLIQSINADKARKKKRITYFITILIVIIAVGIGATLYFVNSSKAEVKMQSTELTSMKSEIHNLIKDGKYDEAFEQMDKIKNYMIVHETEHPNFEDIAGDLYLKLVVALIHDDNLPGAAMVGLDYREKLHDDYKWHNSQVFKVLIQECEVQNYDDSPLH